MVGQSELAFRLLTRKYGMELAYTPMMNANMIVNAGLKGCWEVGGGEGEDRPLIAQLCGNDPDIICAAAKMVQGSCDAVDINLGVCVCEDDKLFYFLSAWNLKLVPH